MTVRRLDANMSKFLRARIPMPDAQLSDIDGSVGFMMAMAAHCGITEQGGNNRGPQVRYDQYTVGLSQGDSWCMAMVQTALRFAELWSGKISKIYAGGNCLDVYNNSPQNQVAPHDLRPGDLIIFQHGQTSSGHVAMISDLIAVPGVEGWAAAFTVEGNTSSGPGLSTDGDGAYYKMRSLLVPVGDLHIRGFLRPFP